MFNFLSCVIPPREGHRVALSPGGLGSHSNNQEPVFICSRGCMEYPVLGRLTWAHAGLVALPLGRHPAGICPQSSQIMRLGRHQGWREGQMGTMGGTLRWRCRPVSPVSPLQLDCRRATTLTQAERRTRVWAQMESTGRTGVGFIIKGWGFFRTTIIP